MVNSLGLLFVGAYLLRLAAAAAGTLINLKFGALDAAGFHHVKATSLGFAIAGFYIAELLSAPLSGALSDLWGRHRPLLLGPIFGVVAIPFVALSNALLGVFAAKLCQGLSAGVSTPPMLSILADEAGEDEARRGRVMALFEAATILGLGSGVVAAGFLWDFLRLWAFGVVAGLYGLSLLALSTVPIRRGVRADHWRLKELAAGLRHILGLAPAWVAVNAVVGVWLSHAAFQMTRRKDPAQLLVGGFTGSEFGTAAGIVLLLFVVGVVAWGQVLGRVGSVRAMRIGLAGLGLTAAGLFLVNHSIGASHTRIVVLLLISAAGLLVMSGFTPAALSYLGAISERFQAERGTIMGIYSVLLGVGQLIGSSLGGIFADWRGVDGLILLTVALGGISAVAVSRLRAAPEAGPVKAARPVPD